MNSERTMAAPIILIVENEVLVRMAVAAYLRECGFKVVEARTAAEALRVFESDTAIDVLFCGVSIPGDMDGFGLAQWVRRERPQTKVILTSSVRRSAEEAGTLCKEGPHLAKPYDHRDLERRIRRLLAREA
jgi:DNA-binding response OmpR family regulator